MNEDSTTRAEPTRVVAPPTTAAADVHTARIKAQRTFDALLCDFERQGKHLTLDDVNRVLSRRKLGMIESTLVFKMLSDASIDVSLPEEPEFAPPARRRLSADLVDDYTGVAAQAGFLTREEEVDLGRRIRLGKSAEAAPRDPGAEQRILAAKRARERLVECNLRLVIYWAKRIPRYGSITAEDLIQEGMSGLLRTIETWDPERGVKLSTYASFWIRQRMIRAIEEKSRIIRLPVNVGADLRMLRRKAQRLAFKLGRAPTTKEVADDTGLTFERIAFLNMITQDARPLRAPDADAEDAAPMIPVPQGTEPGPPEFASDNELSDLIDAIVSELPEREARIIRERFGLGETEPMTLRDLGDDLGISGERVRQLETTALKRLRNPKRSGTLGSFLD